MMLPRAPARARARAAPLAAMRLVVLACLAAVARGFQKPSADWQLQMGTPVGPEEAAALREEVREMVRGLRGRA